MNRRWRKLSGASSGLFLILAIASTASAGPTTAKEVIDGTRHTDQYTDDGNTYGPFDWNIHYTRGFDGTNFYKDVQINFDFTNSGLTAGQQLNYVATVKAGVEAVWDNKFVIHDNNTGTDYKIVLNLTTAGPFDQTVKVLKGNGRDDMTKWYVGSTTVINAHEVGHMLGLYDEYIGGAVDKYPNPTLSNDGLMGLGALNAKPVMYSRYYQQFLDYAESNDKTGSYTLKAVPEPATLAMSLISIVCVVGANRVRTRRRDRSS